MDGALVFLFLTWHIRSVSGLLMAGAITENIARCYSAGALFHRDH